MLEDVKLAVLSPSNNLDHPPQFDPARTIPGCRSVGGTGDGKTESWLDNSSKPQLALRYGGSDPECSGSRQFLSNQA